MKKRLDGQVALITGGAGGLGSVITKKLADAGCHMAIHYHTSNERAAQLKDEIIHKGVDCQIFMADLTMRSQVTNLISGVIDYFGRLDILINNAGWSRLVIPKDLDGLTDDLINRTITLKVHAPIYTIVAASQYLKSSMNGVVVNITSASGHAARGSSIVYAAANAALYNLTRSFARILAPEIRVNAVAPGYIETGFVFPEDGNMARQVASQNYTGRVVTTEEIADVVLFLCTEGLSITGEEIVVDGGIARLGKK